MTWWQATIDWVMARPVIYAPASGLLVSLLFTQLLKFLYPRRWRELQRRRAIVATAMVLAGAATYALYPETLGAVEALIVALAAPMSYHYGVRLLALKWPSLRDVLSADREPTGGR